MREIKFRAWDSQQKDMIKNITLDVLKNLSHPQKQTMQSVAIAYSWKDLEFMQYTGLTDKNGVPIYEGDIFVDKDHVYVEYDNHQSAFVATWKGIPDWDMPVRLSAYSNQDIEVIGNIYQNPELLGRN